MLLDVSRVDAPGTLVAQQTLENPGTLPVSISIPYDSALIDSRRNYVVRAAVRTNGRLAWVSSRSHAVLTHGSGNNVNILLRQTGSSEDEIPGDLLLAGEMTYLGDVARLTECTTGRVFPISREADFNDMIQTYSTMTRSPGAPLYVTFDGTISPRPVGTGAPELTATIVVREFVDAWPRLSCESNTEEVPLLGTRWHITRVGDWRVSGLAGRSEPHMVLAGQGDSLTYSVTVGCNEIGGKATRMGDKIAFAAGTGTMMACGSPLDTLERRLIQALTETTTWRVFGKTLEFENKTGKSAVLFEARNVTRRPDRPR